MVVRDYVIEAFNRDKPYDQFVTEQMAGDVLGAGAATGFLVAGPHVPAATVGREPSAIRQARADRMDEIMQTIGASMLGITMNCARCHTHKFDPITLKDYYAMSAVFQDIEFGSRKVEWPAQDARQQKALDLQDSLQKARDPLRDLGPGKKTGPPTEPGIFRLFRPRPFGCDFSSPMSPSMNWKSWGLRNLG